MHDSRERCLDEIAAAQAAIARDGATPGALLWLDDWFFELLLIDECWQDEQRETVAR